MAKMNVSSRTVVLINVFAAYSAAIFLIPICISFDTAEKHRYATYLILNRRFSFEF
ncbi:stress response membrane protein YncL [Shigella sonnei]